VQSYRLVQTLQPGIGASQCHA